MDRPGTRKLVDMPRALTSRRWATAADPEVRRACLHQVVSSGGTAAIGSVAREVGWSHKHLISKFREQAGLAPKTAATIVRSERVM